MSSPIGRRVHIIGGTNAGKSTLAARLADLLGLPHVELDALNWRPGWVSRVEVDPEGLGRDLEAVAAGDGWVVDGDYSRFTRPILWPRLETVIFLDLPRSVAVKRVLARSWQRWRSGELLWGTNRESFWEQLAIWRCEDSLLWWAWTQHGRKRDRLIQEMADPRYARIRFVRLTSQAEVETFIGLVEAAVAGTEEPDPPACGFVQSCSGPPSPTG